MILMENGRRSPDVVAYPPTPALCQQQGEVIDCDGIAYRIIAAKHWNRFTELWGRRA